MTRKLTPIGVAALVAALISLPIRLLADVASCSLATSSYADTIINPSKGEDTEFFVSTGGVPNLMFLIDTSGSMMSMAPDGARDTWGSFEKPGNTTGGGGFGCYNAFANARVFSSPCGYTTLDGSPYNPTPGSANPNDYYEAKDSKGNYCPYMVSGNQPPATNLPGFDPDFPAFFPKDRVIRDGAWSITAPSPETEASVALFCARTGFSAAQQSSCGACMRDQGYWFDGTYPSGGTRRCATTADCTLHGDGVCLATNSSTGVEYNGATKSGYCRLPNVYFAGNFLNFFPPKFLMARKVLKDVLMSVRRVRLGITTFGTGSGALLDALNPPCNMFGSPSNFDSNRSQLLSDINKKLSFNTATPLSETLLQVGEYYRTGVLPWFNSTYQYSGFEEKSGQNKSVCFSCQASAVLVLTDGLPNRDSRIPGTDFAASGMTKAVADAPGSYAGMAGYNIKGISTTDCPSCETWAELADTAIAAGQCNGNQDSGACDDSGNPAISYLPRVAWYLKNMDFRQNTEVGSDGFAFTGKQSLTTYTIGLGTRGAAHEILRHTAETGGGLFNGGSGGDVVDVRTLKDAIMKVLEDVNTRSTSFGAASFSTLQVASTQGVLVPRFEPARSAHWDGHLYAFDLFSEFTSGTTPVPGKVVCVPGLNPSGPANGDYDCDGACNSVFLVDKDGAFIQEDGTGAFKKNLNRNLTACGSTTLCGASSCSGPDLNTPAVPYWDAGSKLAPVKKSVDPVTGSTAESANPDFASGRLDWSLRKIFTAIDRNGDGKLTSADMPLVDLRTADPATMVPYLNIQGSKYCNSLSQRLTAQGNPAGATIDAEVAAGTYTTCARLLLYFVRGADILNERVGDPACSNYPSATNPSGTYCTRKYQLGDIFHSSPVEVYPPFASDAQHGFSCPRGEANQCLTALWSPTVPGLSLDGYQYAYDDYQQNPRYVARRKFVLVGANDGLLHAFQIERFVTGSTSILNPRAGEEIWAFVPPDLLPKLRLLTEATHQFYVDGTAMVRDVWIDGGVLNKMHGGGTRAPDGARQGDEFHTVAVVGERRGGTHYFALDVTEASDDLDGQPRFLWIYPQPNDPEQLQFGETYVDFLPIPPPIGPVRIDAGVASADCKSVYSNAATGTSRCFEERYVAMLSGGFDPQYTRGRGVHMVDIATGEEVWDFSQPAGTGLGCGAASDPRCHLNYPIAATVAMVQWGDQEAQQLGAQDWYFDTAIFGDTGGQLWVARFAEPGMGWAPGAGTKVTNWYGARTYQGGLSPSTPACGLDYCGGQPFFYIAAAVALNENNYLRALVQSGDRYNLLDPVGGVCGPDNLRACLLKGCTVTLNDGTALAGPGAIYALETLLGTQSYKMTGTASCTATPVGDFSFTKAGGVSGGTCGPSTQKVDALSISCPSTLTCSAAPEATAKTASVACTGTSCDPAPLNDYGTTIDLKGNPDKVNQAFSIKIWDEGLGAPRRIFHGAAAALAYDGVRYQDSNLKDITPFDTTLNPSYLASTGGPGWRYVFSHGETATSGPVTITINGLSYNIYRTDEREASVPNVQAGCGFWNTMQTATPVGALDPTTECPVNSPCKAGRSQISYLYGADPADGSFCMTVNGAPGRSQKNETLVPPTMGKQVAYVSGTQVAFGLTSVRVPQGGANVSLGAAQDLASIIEWLPIDKATHKCRHGTRDSTGNLTLPTADDCK